VERLVFDGSQHAKTAAAILPRFFSYPRVRCGSILWIGQGPIWFRIFYPERTQLYFVIHRNLLFYKETHC
jgi:hypothetical protein